MNEVFILDTTLRDGEQAPGCSMSISTKIEIAEKLDDAGVHVIEAGFPISSPIQFKACKEIAHRLKKSTMCVLSRATEKDMTASYKATSKATKSRVNIFLPSSDLHIEKKLGKTRTDVIALTKQSVLMAKNMFDEVEFACEDATRSDKNFLLEMIDTAVSFGANIINIADTVGYMVDTEIKDLLSFLYQKLPVLKEKTLSIHTHNDLGCALSNALYAYDAGVRQFEGSLGGIGERAGLLSLNLFLKIIEEKKSEECFCRVSSESLNKIFTSMEIASNYITPLSSFTKIEYTTYKESVLKYKDLYYASVYKLSSSVKTAKAYSSSLTMALLKARERIEK